MSNFVSKVIKFGTTKAARTSDFDASFPQDQKGFFKVVMIQ